MRLILVEGTFAKDPWGLLGDVVYRVNLAAERIKYPEQFGDTYSYRESVDIGKRSLRKKLLNISEPYILIGYSQGAHIAGDVSLEFKDDPNFIRVYMIADPKRSSRDKVIGPPVDGTGVFGPRPIGPKAYHFAAPGDFITANVNPFIYNVAQYTITRKAKFKNDWWTIYKNASNARQSGGKVWAAFKQLRFYLSSQIHTSYDKYVVENGKTATQWIAEDVNRLVEELA